MDDTDIDRLISQRPRVRGFSPSNPDPRAVRLVRDPLPVPTACRCGGGVELKHHETAYGRAYSNWPWLYRCAACGAQVGLHPGTSIPLGTLADAPTRAARSHAHAVFDPMWRDRGPFARGAAYAWLAQAMGLPLERCHISMMDVEQCKRAAALCMQRRFSAR